MKKMMKKMKKQGQMDFDEVENVEEVIIRTAEKEIVISEAQVTKLIIPGQGEMWQIVGEGKDRARGTLISEAPEEEQVEAAEMEDDFEVSPGDAQLVSMQAGVSIDDATAALKQTKGDLAKAILMLKEL